MNLTIDPENDITLNEDNFRFKANDKSKRLVLMETELKKLVNQMKGDYCIPKMGSQACKRTLFFLTDLNNLHSSIHCRACFMNKKCECRMKLPMKRCDGNNIDFDHKFKYWYD